MSADESPDPVQPGLPEDRPTEEAWRYPPHPVHAVYAVAMLAAAVAMVGPGGLVLGVPIVATWACVFYRVPHNDELRHVLLVGGWLCLSCWLGLPFLSSAREAARRLVCSNRLKQIALALHHYHDQYGTLPPAYLIDADGRPAHSWRVLILPYLEQAELYARYRFDEPWDGPTNRRLAAPMPGVFACPSDERGFMSGNTMTSYLAVVGPATVWPGERGRAFSELNEGGSNPLLILESHSQTVEWMEPRDVDFDTAVQLLTAVEPFDDGHVRREFFYDQHLGRNIAVADGTCWFVPLIAREPAESLLRIDHGRQTPDAWFQVDNAEGVWRANYGNWFLFGMFLVLTFFPLPWVFRPGAPNGPTRTTAPEA